MAEHTKFGDILKAARKAQGLTQSQMEAKSGIGLRNLAYLESGDSNPNLRTMLLLAAALGANLKIEFELEKKPVELEKVYDFETFLRESGIFRESIKTNK